MSTDVDRRLKNAFKKIFLPVSQGGLGYQYGDSQKRQAWEWFQIGANEFRKLAANVVFLPHWPEGLVDRAFYRIPCDDKGRKGGSWLQVMIAQDGDVHVSMQDMEDPETDKPSPFPSIRIRTFVGGGRNERTRQALLWLAKAIKMDNEENKRESAV